MTETIANSTGTLEITEITEASKITEATEIIRQIKTAGGHLKLARRGPGCGDHGGRGDHGHSDRVVTVVGASRVPKDLLDKAKAHRDGIRRVLESGSISGSTFGSRSEIEPGPGPGPRFESQELKPRHPEATGVVPDLAVFQDLGWQSVVRILLETHVGDPDFQPVTVHRDGSVVLGVPPNVASGVVPVDVNDLWWDSLDPDDQQDLLSFRRPRSPCPWCRGLTVHSEACRELQKEWIPKLKFGKYQGKKLDQVPPRYLRWLYLQTSCLNSDLRQDVERILEPTELRIEPWQRKSGLESPMDAGDTDTDTATVTDPDNQDPDPE